jgi:hypothetical protein
LIGTVTTMPAFLACAAAIPGRSASPGVSLLDSSSSFWFSQSVPALEALFSQLYAVSRLPPMRVNAPFAKPPVRAPLTP